MAPLRLGGQVNSLHHAPDDLELAPRAVTSPKAPYAAALSRRRSCEALKDRRVLLDLCERSLRPCPINSHAIVGGAEQTVRVLDLEEQPVSAFRRLALMEAPSVNG